MLVDLIDLDISAADVGNACLIVLYRKIIWNIACTKFVSDKGIAMIVVGGLYEFNIFVLELRSMIEQPLQYIGYESFLADPDI